MRQFYVKNMTNYCSKSCEQQRFTISRFEFFVIYKLFSINWTLSIFDFFAIFYLVSFNSTSHKFTKLGSYDKNIQITLNATSISGFAHLGTGPLCCGRSSSGSNPGHTWHFYFSLNFYCPYLWKLVCNNYLHTEIKNAGKFRFYSHRYGIILVTHSYWLHRFVQKNNSPFLSLTHFP